MSELFGALTTILVIFGGSYVLVLLGSLTQTAVRARRARRRRSRKISDIMLQRHIDTHY